MVVEEVVEKVDGGLVNGALVGAVWRAATVGGPPGMVALRDGGCGLKGVAGGGEGWGGVFEAEGGVLGDEVVYQGEEFVGEWGEVFFEALDGAFKILEGHLIWPPGRQFVR